MHSINRDRVTFTQLNVTAAGAGRLPVSLFVSTWISGASELLTSTVAIYVEAQKEGPYDTKRCQSEVEWNNLGPSSSSSCCCYGTLNKHINPHFMPVPYKYATTREKWTAQCRRLHLGVLKTFLPVTLQSAAKQTYNSQWRCEPQLFWERIHPRLSSVTNKASKAIALLPPQGHIVLAK